MPCSTGISTTSPHHDARPTSRPRPDTPLLLDDAQSLPRKSINAILTTTAAPLSAQKACSDTTMAAPATDGAQTAALSPTSPDGFASQSLRSSISSLGSPAAARQAASYVSKTYRQSSTLFLTRRLPEALSTITPLITVTPPSPSQPQGTNGTSATNEPAPVAKASRNTRIKVWTLYIAILNAIVALEPDEGKESLGTHEWRALCAKVRDGDVWEEVVQNGYHGVEADVDADVVINLATLLLTHARTQALNQKRLENYLAASATPNLDLSDHFSPGPPPPPRGGPARPRSQSRARSGADTPRDLNARVKILELYTLHVLIRNDEWDYAREFISASSVLDEERREAFLQALQSLQEDQLEADRRERDERLRQEEQLRRDVEEARRLRAENEGRERRRLEEERARRREGGSEVDYGIDAGGGGGGRASSVGGSSAGKGASRRTRAQTGGSSRSSRAARANAAAGGGTSPNKSKAVAPASLGARAAVVFANVRAMIERMSVTLHTNPMLLMRLLAFIIGLVVMFGKKNMRDRIARILGTSWNKVKATAGMGVKVSYI
ncbi:hypothetical protein KVR01_004637 [Diaporthe batatas]|uniref:uncharacterized protein n=1 Tax=Diaporthe batatas TaxID=748121 RepID=UPI001D0581E0|nr:uncharacterized protein KVR01_004637 [Diaporthe batatas]KAG8166085.1 hypothetical protein KVR01_004637 [Diaporthe batatas]